MDNYNVVHEYYGMLFSSKEKQNNEIDSKWLDLENTNVICTLICAPLF